MATVRPADRADMQRIREIAQRNSSAAQWSEKQYERLFAEKSAQHMVLVVDEAERVQGFIVGRLAGDQWEIENIAVDPHAQHRKLGSQLVCEFLERARPTGSAVFLEVRESNLGARKFYEKMGFIERGRRNSYYQSPVEDALILQLSF